MITNNCKFMGTVFEITPISMTQSGKKVCKLTISIRVGKDQEGKGIYEYIPCRAYEQRAELLARYFTKGKAIALETHVHRYKGNDGTTYTEFIVDDLAFVPSDFTQEKPQERPTQPQPAPLADYGQPLGGYDLPF